MSPLVIEYRLDGKQPGYAFRQPTNGYSDSLLKTVWRHAMPRGQGWSAEVYRSARALKCFPTSGGWVALSETEVTDQADEQGRRGIRRVEIDLLGEAQVIASLKQRLESYPEAVRRAALTRLNLPRWMAIIERALPKISRRESQVVLTHPYRGREQWQMIEVMVLHLATAWLLRAMPGWGHRFSFTTLALSHEEESRLIAMPLDKAQLICDRSVIVIEE